MVLPPDGVLDAAGRWVALLKSGVSVERAWGIIRYAPTYASLSVTQYATALDWIADLGLVSELARGGPPSESRLFSSALSALSPAWLNDADVLLDDPADLPLDALRLAELLGLPEPRILPMIKRVARKADPELAARIGLAGEIALVSLLNDALPGCAKHLSLSDDTLGYDIALLAGVEAHLEVKTTTRRGRLVVFLSRHEFEVASTDDAWVLVVVGLDADHEPAALATLGSNVVFDRAPRDVSRFGRWDSVALELGPNDLTQGLAALDSRFSDIDRGIGGRPGFFAWMPVPSAR